MSLGLYIFLQISMWTGVVLSFVLLLPTIYGIYKTNNTTSISKWMYILYPICSVAWIIYSILLWNEPGVDISEIIGLIVSEAVAGIIAATILVLKLRNVHIAKKQHMTEHEWYKAYLKNKEIKKRLKEIGVKSDQDLKDHKIQQARLTKVLDQLFDSYEDIVDDRITSSKQYRKTLKRDIHTPKKRLSHFKNVATNAEIANVIYLIYLDIYQSK